MDSLEVPPPGTVPRPKSRDHPIGRAECRRAGDPADRKPIPRRGSRSDRAAVRRSTSPIVGVRWAKRAESRPEMTQPVMSRGSDCATSRTRPARSHGSSSTGTYARIGSGSGARSRPPSVTRMSPRSRSLRSASSDRKAWGAESSTTIVPGATRLMSRMSATLVAPTIRLAWYSSSGTSCREASSRTSPR